jgi:hypothetical protein
MPGIGHHRPLTFHHRNQSFDALSQGLLPISKQRLQLTNGFRQSVAAAPRCD